ncbi:hypothetical protein SMD22_01650 (plasmid) [Brevibacillus halotolerans]|nr:hypothetical protein SMD22_01650 [Brevibacillus halotolerans]
MKTRYYQYADVWIVKDGSFVEMVKFESLTDEQVNCPVYDCHGNELIVFSI